MARIHARLLLPVILLVSAVAGTLEAGNCGCCKQWMGCGYGPGYNAPAQGGSNWGRGCCEIPANWRLHVWDGYRGDPHDYQRSLVGAQPDVIVMPLGHMHNNMYNSAGSCNNCQNRGGSYKYQTAVPAAGAVPTTTDSQTDLRSGRANASAKILR